MAQLFLSHSSADDGFVRELREALEDLGQEVWIDSASPSLNGQKPSRSSAFMARLLRVSLIWTPLSLRYHCASTLITA